jgi:adenylosuccinate lyase
MPHKRNPVLSENLTGLARIVRSSVVPALENVALWHERDISHSSVERVIAPDATLALDFALVRLAGMMQRLAVHPEQMAANLDSLGGVVHSGEVLLALTRAGISREDATRWPRGRTWAPQTGGISAIIFWPILRCRGRYLRLNWMRQWMPGCT